MTAIGNAYLESVEASFEKDTAIVELLSPFKTIIAVSGQDEGLEALLIPILKEVIRLDESIGFVYVPRRKYINGTKKKYDFPTGIFQIDINIYKAICYSDFHTSIYSTCALEAPALGVRNILIDCNGIASTFFEDSLQNRDVTRYAKTAKEFIKHIESFGISDKQTIKNGHNIHFMTNHKACITAALKKVFNDDI